MKINCYAKNKIVRILIKCVNVLLSSTPKIFIFIETFFVIQRFVTPRIPVYTQAMLNILAQPSTVRASHTVNILTTCFGQVPTDLSERLSPLTTHKSMHHISKNLASALLTANRAQSRC